MKIAETTTIPKLAKASGIDRVTLYRRLMALHAQSGGNWMYRGKKNIRINVAALRAMHPSVFPPVELEGRVEALEEKSGEHTYEIGQQAKAMGSVVRRLEVLEAERLAKAS